MRVVCRMGLLLTVTFAGQGGALAQAAPADGRARVVEAQMTDDERFQLLHGVMPVDLAGFPMRPEEFRGIPAVAGYVRGIPRLGIPDLLETDASLGVANPLNMRPDRSTALPSGLAIASTFNPQLAFAGGALVGAETRALGYNVLLGGGVNLARDPRNGRNFEYLGEDPLLAGTLAGEAIRGTQSQGVISTVKHFSLNDQETLRNTLDAHITERAHRESDLLAFEIAIERGQPGSVMCAYNLVNGVHACANDHLLNGVLKRDWGYKGWVMSDWGAVGDASYFNGGLDQQSGSQLDGKTWFDQPLRAEYAAGRVSKARLSDAVRRILRSLYAVGADRPAAKTAIDYGAHAAVARAVAAEGTVLLKNDGILPLAGRPKSVIVIGGYAHVGVMSGGGSSQVMPVGEPAATIPMGGPGVMGLFGRQILIPSSPVAALKSELPDTDVEFDSGYNIAAAAARAAHADVAIVFATQWQMEGFDGDMALPGGQDALIAAVAAANPNLIVVLETGNPVRMPWLNQARAVMEAWYPGQKGGEAIADILTGKVNPSGRLPLSWPSDESQLPRASIPGFGAPAGTAIRVDYDEGAAVGYKWFAAQHEQPLYAFGHGLSYTRFEYSNLRVSRSSGTGIVAQVTVSNRGDRDGSDAPQIYLVARAGEPALRLVGFDKTALRAGQSKDVRFSIDPRLLAEWNGRGWTVRSGAYGFAVGASAAELGSPVVISLPQSKLKP